MSSIAISRWSGRDREKGGITNGGWGKCGSGPGLEVPPQLAVAPRSNVETLKSCALEAAPETTETSVLAGNLKCMVVCGWALDSDISGGFSP